MRQRSCWFWIYATALSCQRAVPAAMQPGSPGPLAATARSISVAPESQRSEAANASTVPAASASAAPGATHAQPPQQAVAFTRASVGELEFRLRTDEPEALVIDGSIDEWLDGSAHGGQVIVLTLTPTRLFLAFEVNPAAVAEFELRLPGDELPEIGEIVRGGGTFDVDCEHPPYTPEKRRTPASRRTCLEISRRFAALKERQHARFVTTFALTETDPSSIARSCRRLAERLQCEAEYPLQRLPRTSALDLGEVELRLGAPAKGAAWLALALPRPVAFAAGLELRRVVLPEQAPYIEEQSRYSYQPGEANEYEVAARQGPMGWGMADVSITRCRLSAVVAEFGRAQIRRACGGEGPGIVFVDGAPQSTFELPSDSHFIQKVNALIFVSQSNWYAPETGESGRGFYVGQLAADGTWAASQSIDLSSDGCRSVKAEHDANFERLTLTCTPKKSANPLPSPLKRSLVWSEQSGRYEASEN